MKRLIIVVMLFLFSSGAQAEILFQDPTGKALNDAFDSLSEKEVKDISLPGIGRKKYLLGLLYLNGDKEFRVEKNCEESFKLLNDASKRGISDAKYALATMYYHGVCTKKILIKLEDCRLKRHKRGTFSHNACWVWPM